MSAQDSGQIEVGMLAIDESTQTPCRVIVSLEPEIIDIMGDEYELAMFRVTDGETERGVAGFNLSQTHLTTVGEMMASGSYGVGCS